MKIDLDKVIKWLSCYFDGIEEGISKYGKTIVIKESINILILNGYLEEYLRKDLSFYIKRIVSIEEFERLKNWGI